MRMIPLPRRDYEDIAISHELRRYCGEGKSRMYKTDLIPDPAVGEEITIFAAGRKPAGKKRTFEKLVCVVRKTQPETEIEVVDTYPEFNKLYPGRQ